MKVSKQRKFVAGAAIVLLLQSAGGVAGTSYAEGQESVPSGREGMIPISQPQEYAPFTVFEGFSGEIPFPAPTLVEQDQLLVPARALLERLGYRIEWDEAQRAVIAQKIGTELVFPMDQGLFAINGIKQVLPVSSRLVGDTAYVPLRLAAEADLREVLWRDYNQTIVIREANSLVSVRAIAVMDTPLSQEVLKEQATKAGALSGLQLQLNAVATPNYQQKVNVLIAANDLPELLLIPDPFFLQTSLLHSVFWNLKPFLQDYPHLNQAVKLLGNRIELKDGGIYGIPRMHSAYDGVFPAIHKDWLDRLGDQAPQTMEELLRVLGDFQAKDPDANGKLDTIALSASMGPTGLGSLAWVENVFNESGGRYVQSDGRIVDTWLEPGTKEALTWLTKAYAGGLINKDYPVATAEQAKRTLTEGHAGVMAMTGLEAGEVAHLLNSDFVALPFLQAKTGGKKVIPVSMGHTGIFAIPKSVTESKVKRILAFMETWLSLDERSASETQALWPLEPFFGGTSTVADDTVDIWNARERIGAESLQDPTLGLFTNDMSAMLFDSTQKLTQTKIKVILGKLPLAAWDMAVEEVKQDPQYRQVMDQLNKR